MARARPRVAGRDWPSSTAPWHSARSFQSPPSRALGVNALRMRQPDGACAATLWPWRSGAQWLECLGGALRPRLERLPMAKVCAVFGGSRGIGKAVAQLLVQKGYRLAIIARNLEVAQTTANHLGAGHLALSCDVVKEQDVQNTFEEMERNLGPINYLVNAAGINRDGLLLRTKTEDMISQIHTNLLGTMLTCKAAVRSMIQQQGGAIVNIGSIVGLKGNPGQSVYSASKAGLVGFSRSLAKEVARKKIRVNMVAPGFVRTDMTAHLKEEQMTKTIPLGRFGEPHEVAQAVIFLLESPYVTGHILVVDGGLQLLA
ncbi:carbonyl reductase family member 4 isoform X1 [Alligator sinensis]|uniref:3-ketoacyl-[acyl-carrier-protein] reductase beta subunit n=2 Tax=Alligator sinensis TaxID=38654 RepID=A0A1U7RUR3_ALLSI|nr:carbonyl reductase family member 4 isoform X1 [Alligator sinensis]